MFWQMKRKDFRKSPLVHFSAKRRENHTGMLRDFSRQAFQIYGHMGRTDFQHIIAMRHLPQTLPPPNQRQSHDDCIRAIYEAASAPLVEKRYSFAYKPGTRKSVLPLAISVPGLCAIRTLCQWGRTIIIFFLKRKRLDPALLSTIESSLQNHLRRTGLPCVLIAETLRTFAHVLPEGTTQRDLYTHLRRENTGRLAYECCPRVASNPGD